MGIADFFEISWIPVWFQTVNKKTRIHEIILIDADGNPLQPAGEIKKIEKN